jgi:hypothetical protein
MDVTPFNKDDIYASYNEKNLSYIPPPKSSLNGGLYTGEPFNVGAEYRNFPNIPDSVHLHTKSLSSANPPPGAQNQFPDSFRPGNNMPDITGMQFNKYSSTHAIVCTQKTPKKEDIVKN